MKQRSTFTKPLAIVLTLLLAGLLAGPASAKKGKKKNRKAEQTEAEQVAEPRAADALPPGGDDESALWADPQFRREFLGSFGVNSEIEPRISAVEFETMQKILPLISTDSEAAIAELEKAIEGDSSAVFDFTLGNIHFQEGQTAEAAVHYRNALAKFPNFRRAHKNLGLIQVRTGQCDEAIRSLQRVIELGDNEPLTYGLLGQCYVEKEQYLAAETAYRKAMLLQPDRLHWKLGLTQSVLRQERYSEALTLSRELIKEDPNNADYWMLQANAYIGLERPLDAASNFEIVRRMGKATRQSLYTLGDIYVNEGLWELAADTYVDAIEIDPQQDPDRAVRCVEILSQRSAAEQAEILMAQVRRTFDGRLDDDQRKKLLKLEARAAIAEDKGGDAVAVLEEIVALDPLDGDALILLGQHYGRTGDEERAIFYYERAMNIDKFEADATVRKAQLLVGSQRYAEAVPLLKRAQAIEPRENVGRYLEQVERAARTQQ